MEYYFYYCLDMVAPALPVKAGANKSLYREVFLPSDFPKGLPVLF
jgi:hypothetical protein